MTDQTHPGYVPTPRPTFDSPTVIRFEDAVTATWGDDASGHVFDRIFVSSSKIHHIVYELEPHGGFTHSEEYRTIFAANEVMYVLSGELVLANPETGDVVRAVRGDAVVFGPDTWHHGFNESAETLRVLEFFAPPPSRGTSGAYARTKPMLKRNVYARDELLASWPDGSAFDPPATLRVVREPDYLWRLEGETGRSLFGVIASWPELTVGKLRLPPDRSTDARRHGGDMSMLVTAGTVTTHLADDAVDLRTNDALYVPEGDEYRLQNTSGQPAEIVCGVAPRYLS